MSVHYNQLPSILPPIYSRVAKRVSPQSKEPKAAPLSSGSSAGSEEPFDPEQSILPKRQAWLVLAVVSLTSFQTALSLSVIFIVFPELSDAFPEASNAQLSWVINVFSIVGAAALVLAGAIGERIGRKRIILWGTAAFSVASAMAALAPNVTILILARVAQALASVTTLPAGAATIIAAFPRDRRGTAIGTWSAAGGVAAAMGPSLGGILIDVGGWQAAFWINVPMGAIAFVAAWLVIPEYRLKTKELLPDPLGSGVLALGVSGIVLAIVQTQEWQWLDARTIAVGLAGIAAVVWLLYRSSRHRSPILDLRLFHYPSFAFGNISMTLLAFGFFAFQFSGILFLTEVWDYEVREAGLLSTPIFACTAMGSSVAGRLTDRFGAAKVVIPGGVMWLAGIGLLALSVSETRDLGLWLTGVSLGGVGSGLMWGGVFAAVVIDLPEYFIALGTSVTQTLMRIGTSIGVAVAVTIIGTEITDSSVGLFKGSFAMSALMCAVATLFLMGSFKREGPKQQPASQE